MANKLYDALTRTKSRHGRCSGWIRENRRRRAAGLPQKRVLPFGMGVFDPIDRSVTKTLEDSTKEVTHV